VRLAQRTEDIFDSYINANYVNSSCKRNDRMFIAAQGPLDATRDNFWRMVDQENVSLIVMLTDLKENGKVKCDQYWPTCATDQVFFDNCKQRVTLKSIDLISDGLIRRKLSIGNKQITHLQYLRWPDHEAPEQ